MAIGTLQQVYEDMESGVYNFCKDGKCIGCGQCCSDFLPLSSKEIKNIKRYMKKKHIKECVHTILPSNEPTLDMTCPFLDTSKEKDKCTIYEVRPEICRVFQCDQPPSKIQANKALFWKNRKPCSMRKIFFESEE